MLGSVLFSCSCIPRDSPRLGHGRSLSGLGYQRKGARPAASITPPTAVNDYDSISHVMYLNKSDARSTEKGTFWASTCRHVQTPSTGAPTQTKGVNGLSASESTLSSAWWSRLEHLTFTLTPNWLSKSIETHSSPKRQKSYDDFCRHHPWGACDGLQRSVLGLFDIRHR